MSWFFDNLFKRGKAKTDTAIDKSRNETSKADQKFTSYDTSKKDTSTPQKVREANEPEAQQQRIKRSHGGMVDTDTKSSPNKKKKKKK